MVSPILQFVYEVKFILLIQNFLFLSQNIMQIPWSVSPPPLQKGIKGVPFSWIASFLHPIWVIVHSLPESLHRSLACSSTWRSSPLSWSSPLWSSSPFHLLMLKNVSREICVYQWREASTVSALKGCWLFSMVTYWILNSRFRSSVILIHLR